MVPPRLTTYIRTFGKVSAEQPCHKPDLEKKRKQRLLQQQQRAVNIQKVREVLVKYHGEVPALKLLKDLEIITQNVVGTEIIFGQLEDYKLCLLKTFYDSKSVSKVQTEKLRKVFGEFPQTQADRACKVVNFMRESIPDDAWLALFTEERDDDCNKREMFGSHIKFIEPVHRPSYDNGDYDWLLYEPTSEKQNQSEFSMFYEHVPVEEPKPVEKKKKAKCNMYDGGWLRQMVEQVQELVMSVNDLCAAIFDRLLSSKSNDALQDELFELLGFENIELIEQLLLHRKDVIASTMKPELSAPKAAATTKAPVSRPQYGCQVIVQSETEKQMNKVIRKEEKKLQERKRRTEDDDEDEMTFDPEHLRSQREAALQATVNCPLFKSLTSTDRTTPRQKYPFVFDAFAEAKQDSAFVAGSKMMLPINTKKDNNKTYEEVFIPPSDKAPTNVGGDKVHISELDEIGQLAFRGMKHLNTIQSVVFQTAYYSNENMLICAPTGAGKTNVALLTIVNLIKQHLEQNVVKKDEFKIVYVAPMKALAAEMTRSFGERLEPLGITVRELTGDMQLSKAEITKTQMLVTTPEKWDVVTRKSTGDVALTQIVKLLIIDEVHLLHDDRGSVIESLVARTLRQVESSQRMIRIVGLSATLPNYADVATFLSVNPYKGLFVFDGRFRPVPLAQTFVGIKGRGIQQLQDFNEVCFEKVLEQVKSGHQVMVFVHARNETVRTAFVLNEFAKNRGKSELFLPGKSPQLGDALKHVSKSRNKQLRELFPDGFATHHAGMLRQDRNLVEKYFAQGFIRCLVCTATLAWGVNLPAHAVVIKGTQIYDAKKGAFIDLSILDVQQIFGRAGRPQYDTYGHGIILTTHDKLSHYLGLLTQQSPIESQFIQSLTDNLNAEISLGTVNTVEDAVIWLSYTYLYVRMRMNPLVYGITMKDLELDRSLEHHRRDLITRASSQLDQARMIRYQERTGYLFATDLGRTASHFYIKYATVEVINELMREVMAEDKILELVSKASEFEQIKVRDEEMDELDELLHYCKVPVAGGSENTYGKVNILLQGYISRDSVRNFSLVSDQAYVAQNGSRIIRALFEVALHRDWPIMAGRLLKLSKMMDRRQWGFETPLRQFGVLPQHIVERLESNKRITTDKLREMPAKEIGLMVHHLDMGRKIKDCLAQLPSISLEATIQPITRTVLRVRLNIQAHFKWSDRIHGKSESFWIWVEDPDTNHIYHKELFLITKKQVESREPQELVFTIPIFEPLPSQYYIRATSDRWLDSETSVALSFKHLILPEKHPPHTELLDLQPLPVSALNDPRLEELYSFTHFNPVQTQVFHTLYHTDTNTLLGAPTGSGKTVAAELAIFRVFREYPQSKCVYIAPLKALVRERMDDWKVRFKQKLGKGVVELTGDVAPDMRAVASADLIVTTPEKWDGISRSWQTRAYVQAVRLLVIDEIHLLGNDRGPVLEVIVSRTNFISSHTTRKVRVVGLSTALANARDLADWLGIKQMGLFNFRPSVRPVPLEVHIQGFPGKHYCPRMATMNKPCFQAIQIHSPSKPVLIFVSSRRQTRLTALDLIAYLAAEDNPKQWLHMPEHEVDRIVGNIRENNLKLTLAFGIGLHHAGLHERDRNTVEELFVNSKIQVLVATSTLAWGVNFPAHLVIIKGTEYYDGKTKRYVDFPITDVLQMMGRAGRPQFDDQGKAVILVHDAKKHFYKKFLYEPFPVESNLLEVLAEHMNAEVVAETVTSKQDALDYVTWTYFFRRLVMNPIYYKLEETDHVSINRYLSKLVEKALLDLETAYCLKVEEDNRTITPLTLGRIASYYYLHHTTVRTFHDQLKPDTSLNDLIKILSDAHEYSDLPVRHNEDQVNQELSKELPLEVNQYTLDSSNTKTYLLLQAHLCQTSLPSSDYITDTKSVLDQAIRILQAMLDVCADQGWLVTTLRTIHLIQMVIQGRWLQDNTLLTLPHLSLRHLDVLRAGFDLPVECLPQLMDHMERKPVQELKRILHGQLHDEQILQIHDVLKHLPQLEVRLKITGWWEGGPGNEEERQLQLYTPDTPHSHKQWVVLHADQEYSIHVDMKKLNQFRKKSTHAAAHRFPKPKDEGWIFVLGDVESKEVVTLKRVGCVRGSTSISFSFFTPINMGRVVYTLYIMSDSYLGLDQQYDVHLDIISSSIEAQVNTELTDDLFLEDSQSS